MDKSLSQKPESMNNTDEKVLKLNKSLYGWKKSPRYWNKRFDSSMIQQNFIHLSLVVCEITEKPQNICLPLCGTDKQEVKKLKSSLKSTFKMTDMEKITNYVGININQTEGTKEINQMAYLEEILKRFRMYDCKPAPTSLKRNTRILLEA
ncbi:hypothetical protein ILUMI_18829 [Ignelater luminosus]|uniref:Reverse transcriptase Ty1/copia-type domain-containing protein n=1 Tax=Ignelater luminosus TaxID=2038154 RepID=A0A8K0CMU6_IGNLU|nr:hypothetical protein ILUMI_18829 [Ignelater luminosus]